MNPNLAGLGLIMTIAGAAVGFYPVSILGVLVLVVSLLVPSRPPPPRQRSPLGETWRSETRPVQAATRMPPANVQKPVQAVPEPIPRYETPSSPALFPTTMFPFMSLTTPQETPGTEKRQPEKTESKDELVELAALAVFLKLISG